MKFVAAAFLALWALAAVVAIGIVLAFMPFKELEKPFVVAEASSPTHDFLVTQTMDEPWDGVRLRFYARRNGAPVWDAYFIDNDSVYIHWGAIELDEQSGLATFEAYGEPSATLDWNRHSIIVDPGSEQRRFGMNDPVVDPLARVAKRGDASSQIAPCDAVETAAGTGKP